MKKILLVDDHAVVRAGLRSFLESWLSPCHVAEAASGSQAIDLAGSEAWDLVILDLSMPGRDGIEALRAIRHLEPRLPILILTMHDENQLGVRALRAGASGYLTKDAPPEQLLDAVRSVLANGKYLSPHLAAKAAAALAFSEQPPAHYALSDREFQVLRYLARGQTVTEVAGMLALSVKTVSTYRTRILEKLDLRTNSDIVSFALDSGLLRPGV